MAKKFYFLTGKAKWAKLDNKDEKYGYYGLVLYPDEAGWKKYEEAGLQLMKHEDEEGIFIRLRRDPEKLFDDMPEKPGKLIWDPISETYIPFDKLIGNGSDVTCKVEVYQTKKGPGHRLEAVAVENLVPYGDDEDTDLPF